MSEKKIEHYHVRLGHGLVLVHAGHYDGLPAIFINKAKLPGLVGQSVNTKDYFTKDELNRGEIVITFENGSESVLIDRILHAITHFPKKEL
jgi:hypothetical protein